MKIYAPEYYLGFRCIADRCRHSCCVGWRVEVDGECERRLGKTALAARLSQHLGEDNDGKYIKMVDGRCPFLNERGLCDIISELGEEYPAEICREHPRFYNILGDKLEVGLGLCCEEAARIVLSSPSFDKLVVVGECEAEATEPELDIEAHREHILRLLADETVPYREAVKTIAERYSIPRVIFDDAKWRELFCSLEYLGEESRALMSERRHTEGNTHDLYLGRFLGYLIYRHLGAAESYFDLRSRVGFALVGAEALESMLEHYGDCGFDTVTECARIFSEEIEYSEDNTDSIIFEVSQRLF